MNNGRVLKLLIFSALAAVFLSFNSNKAYAADKTDNWKTEVIEEPVLPNKEWNVKFTTGIDVKSLTTENIYLIDSNGQKFTDLKFEPVESVIEGSADNLKEVKEIRIIPTNEYVQDETYSVCVSSGVKSKGGRNLVTPCKLQFKVKKVDSDYFKIRNIKQVSKNVINVYFTQPINEEVEQPLYYEILEDGASFAKGGYRSMNVQVLKDCSNGVQIYLKENSLSEGRNYTVRILGDLVSDYGVRLLDGFGDEADFDGVASENKALALNKAVIRNSTSMELSFNKAVDSQTAENIGNYSIRDSKGAPLQIDKAAVSKEGNKVILNVSGSLAKGHTYTITIRNVKDSIRETTLNLIDYKNEEMNKDEYNLSIVSTQALCNTVVLVKFDRNLDASQDFKTYDFEVQGVSDNSYYKLSSSSVYFNGSEDGKTVKLYLSKPLKYNETYRVIVSKDVKDEYKQKSTKDIQYKFSGVGSKSDDAYVKNVVTIGKKQIKVEFGQEMKNGDANIDAANYSLERNEGANKKITIGCSGVKYVNSTTIILTFDDMDDSENYLLKINSLVDHEGKANNNYATGVDVKLGTY
ncbi:Ig-like domain-containing protein [Clostridium sp. ZS2-4]|uniref:Ig-like domain-containing protein n=1 Tax=Clostridium sp. ZS2-4 TaxID=2987703 RepID=UPI00227B9020|nr:Ig-like domain-containing protein [Clostridium sp. ZS2-4]MCY6355103.1 Ig-like domain-containing protein [Clostridium sp. ZS2-4]